jgi:hypothetical protein
VMRQNYDIRNMRCQKMATRFSIPLLFKLIGLECDHHECCERKWLFRMQNVRENTEKRGED